MHASCESVMKNFKIRQSSCAEEIQGAARKEDEIKHKNFCVEEFNTNQLQTEKNEHEKEDLLVLIEDLELQVKTLTSETDTLKAEIAEMLA